VDRPATPICPVAGAAVDQPSSQGQFLTNRDSQRDFLFLLNSIRSASVLEVSKVLDKIYAQWMVDLLAFDVNVMV
jgi:hypothetical protein